MRTWQIQRSADDEGALRQIGVSSGQLLEAVASGLSAAEMVDPESDPGILRGIWVWGKIFGGLCRELMRFGWRKVETRNWPRVVSGDGSVAIAVMTGDENTGLGSEARPKHRRGPMALIAVSMNQMCLALQDAHATAPAEIQKDLLRTYFLLYRRSADAIHVLLALPRRMEGGTVVEWAQCIRVGSLRLVRVEQSDLEAGRTFDVPIDEKSPMED